MKNKKHNEEREFGNVDSHRTHTGGTESQVILQDEQRKRDRDKTDRVTRHMARRTEAKRTELQNT